MLETVKPALTRRFGRVEATSGRVLRTFSPRTHRTRPQRQCGPNGAEAGLTVFRSNVPIRNGYIQDVRADPEGRRSGGLQKRGGARKGGGRLDARASTHSLPNLKTSCRHEKFSFVRPPPPPPPEAAPCRPNQEFRTAGANNRKNVRPAPPPQPPPESPPTDPILGFAHTKDLHLLHRSFHVTSGV